MHNRTVRTETARELDAYSIVDMPIPVPGPGEVRLRVAACGVGHVDALHATGRYQATATVPFVPGVEVAGTVDALGDGVDSVCVGDRVLVLVSVQSGFADFTIAPAPHLAKLPDAMSFAQAASIRVNALTALYALKNRGGAGSNDTVLVFGAAGGVGSAAVTVANILGARAIAVASTQEKRDFALGLGAAGAVDTDPDDWRQRMVEACGGTGPDIIFDPVCGLLFEPAFRSISWGGRHLVIGFVGGEIPRLKANLPLLKGAALVGVDIRNFNLREPDKAEVNRNLLRQWIADGSFPPPPVEEFPLERFRDALEHAGSGIGLGKTVLTMDRTTMDAPKYNTT
ncbi:MAG: NADPH:quinone oxidoreductase family protein [Rhodobiaceae bacterium]|nr:NADPH:quinone oxidoreductase family protein [Novosphingobium sp.]MCC0057585.1 NADPH:quinone oxidoreductase family protein [Rhodobiaceae bacterium]